LKPVRSPTGHQLTRSRGYPGNLEGAATRLISHRSGTEFIAQP